MIVSVGVNHHSASLEVRARCVAPHHERPRLQARLVNRFGYAVLVSTCGRFELFLDAPPDDADATLGTARAWLARRANVDDATVAASVVTLRGEEAVRHLVRVACGLDSVLVGEDEILGQVRRAWLDAGLAGALSPALDAAFRLAVCTGRQARRLGGDSGWTSLADAAAAAVTAAMVSRSSRRVLIAGTGPMGLRAALSLRAQFGGALDLAIAGRTPERVTTRAREVDARPLSLAEIPAALDWADAAVVGLRTRAPLIGSSDLAPRSPGHSLLIVDLSVPPAVDAAVGRIAGVSLVDVDRLGSESRGQGRWDTAGRARVEALVEQALRRYAAGNATRSDASEALVMLRLQAEAVRRAQVARTLQRMPHLDDEARWRLDALTRAIINRLLHEPTMRLRADTSGDVAVQVQRLFGLPREA